ncbi:MAG: hypothetical protein U0165_16000 [Polyangiaceae bacterium]
MRLHSWVALVALTVLPSVALAAPTAAAKTAAREFTATAVKALGDKDYSKALEYFEKAYALVPAPTLALGRARSLVGLGKYKKAVEVYQAIVTEGAPKNAPAPIVRAVDSAKKEIGETQSKLGSVTITVQSGVKASVTVDGEAFPESQWGSKQTIDPGEHEIVAIAEGKDKLSKKIKVTEGDSLSVKLEWTSSTPVTAPVATKPGEPAAPKTDPAQVNPDAKSEPAAPSEPTQAPRKGSVQRTVGFVALGVGGAALIGGGVVGVLGMGKRSDLDGKCPNGSCPPKYWDDVDTVGRYRTISSIALYSGIALAATGTVLVLTAPKNQETTAWAAPYVGAGQAGFTGAF